MTETESEERGAGKNKSADPPVHVLNPRPTRTHQPIFFS
jgi:hypothetical protein